MLKSASDHPWLVPSNHPYHFIASVLDPSKKLPKNSGPALKYLRQLSSWIWKQYTAALQQLLGSFFFTTHSFWRLIQMPVVSLAGVTLYDQGWWWWWWWWWWRWWWWCLWTWVPLWRQAIPLSPRHSISTDLWLVKGEFLLLLDPKNMCAQLADSRCNHWMHLLCIFMFAKADVSCFLNPNRCIICITCFMHTYNNII